LPQQAVIAKGINNEMREIEKDRERERKRKKRKKINRAAKRIV